jgi:TolA-binding protein
VRVTGPLLEAGRAVVAGETLEVRVPERALEVHRAADAAAAPAPAGEPLAPVVSASAPAASASAAPPLPSRPAESASAPEAPTSWRGLAATGRYREALARAEIEGFAEICGSAGPADLLALGDAARFAGQGGRAREAYLALRARFPGGREAAEVAFLFGRMAFDRDGAPVEAARWFRVYLAEAPGGSYAREARGRLVEALQRSGDREGARVAAVAYLAAHPEGPHAELARSLAAP